MSTIIYGVYCSGGEYEDAFHNLIKAWSRKDSADQHVVELTETRDRKLHGIKVRDDFNALWQTAHPNTRPYPPRRNYPTWAGIRHQDITQAMRDERAGIKAEWQAQADVYGEYMNVREEQRQKECTAFLVSVNISVDLIEELNSKYSSLYSSQEDVQYEIEEVELD